MSKYDFIDSTNVIAFKSDFLGNAEIIAHTSENKKAETLLEHIMLSEKYFQKLAQHRKLNIILNKFSELFLIDCSDSARELFDKMLCNIITFHDYGKINPVFQRNLHNKNYPKLEFESMKSDCVHSRLSAAIYIDYFFREISCYELNKCEQNILNFFVIINSYIISKHHSDLDSGGGFANFVCSCMSNEKICLILNEIGDGGFSNIYLGNIKERESSHKINIVVINKKFKKQFKNCFKDDMYKEISTYVYIYSKFIHSLLIACDYYATSEYKNNIEIKDYGELDEIEKIINEYENTLLVKNIRESLNNNLDGSEISGFKPIDKVRNAMFLETESNILKNLDKNIFYLEAPTGSGKSNMAINLSLKLINNTTRKIFYVYPFNTLVEQNINTLNKVFEGSEIKKKIAVINSIYSILKGKSNNERGETVEENNIEDETEFYQKVLLDRQFLNYPIILTTHVSLFDIMFGCSKESNLGFYQLANSVIVLDEIQSYKNDIWAEIIIFLQAFAKLLNIKVIIMSATLPRLDLLSRLHNQDTCNNMFTSLIENRDVYFKDGIFKDRVKISFELLTDKINKENLAKHLLKKIGRDRNILVEFIRKKSTYEFYDYICEEFESSNEYDGIKIHCITGDYNQIDRQNILNEIGSSKGNILISTQVIEAGVDIDMDIGYKDISKLDSEEQFLGRINRNHKSKYGIAYFFDMDNENNIYHNDFRTADDFKINKADMQEILLEKDYQVYYQKVLERMHINLNNIDNQRGLNYFYENIDELKFYEISKRMELIPRDKVDISVFISRIIKKQDGSILDGNEVWNRYKNLLEDSKMEYAKKQVLLYDVRSDMSNFIYKLNDGIEIYNDRIGEIYFIEDGEKYIENGRLRLEYSGEFL